MATKRKISIRKILQAFVTLVVTSACILAVLGASHVQNNKKLNQIHLQVLNEDKHQFLDKKALWSDLIERKKIIERTTELSHLNIRAIEKTACENPWVANAQVYIDNRRNMHINLVQRTPVARIFLENGESYYLDASLKLLPLSSLFSYYTVVVTNVPVSDNDSISKNLYRSIIQLVKFIEKDTFWNAQIAQVIVTPDLQFELIPILGKHKIIFGDTTKMAAKFDGLFAFYRNVLNRIGWDKYELLDVRFRDQLVASPSLPWKPSGKNAVSNMDWLRSIMGEASKEPAVVTMVPMVSATRPPVTTPKKAEEIRRTEPAAAATNTIITPKHEDEPSGKYIYQGTNNN